MKNAHRRDDLRVKSKGRGAKGEDLLTLEPVVPIQHELRIAYLLQCVEVVAAKAGVTLPTPPAGYIAP